MEVSPGRSTSSATSASGGIGNRSPQEIEERTGFETRVTILGHVQRGGTPTAFDRVLATRFGIAAIDAVHDGAFGQMVALQAGQIVRVPLAEAVGELEDRRPRPVPRRGRGLLRLTQDDGVGARAGVAWPAWAERWSTGSTSMSGRDRCPGSSSTIRRCRTVLAAACSSSGRSTPSCRPRCGARRRRAGRGSRRHRARVVPLGGAVGAVRPCRPAARRRARSAWSSSAPAGCPPAGPARPGGRRYRR